MVSFKSTITNAYVKVKEIIQKAEDHPLLNATARIAISNIPTIGPFILEWYNGVQGTKEDKTKEILKFLEIHKSKNEEYSQLLAEYFDKQGFMMVKNTNMISQLISAEFQTQLMEHKKTQREIIKNRNIISSTRDELSQKLDEIKNEISGKSEQADRDSTIPFIMLENDKSVEILEKIATVINVQLKEGDSFIPFVPFENFDSLLVKPKIYFYGESGCGKSRTIYEIVKNNIKNFKKIYIINPQNDLGMNVETSTPADIVNKIERDDLIIWDKFPEGIIQEQNIESGYDALAKVSSSKVKNLLVALSPELLHLYVDEPFKIHQLHKHEIKYDYKIITKILRTYGKNIQSFDPAYKIVKITDIENIAKILWDVDPTPLTVFDYYGRLIDVIRSRDDTVIDPMEIAKNSLSDAEHYLNQFTSMSEMAERRIEIEFLFALKLSYELGLGRTPEQIAHLQEKLFQTNISTDSLRKLRMWFYRSGKYFAMHDLARNAIRFTEEMKLKVVSIISEKFVEIIPQENRNTNAVGIFFGKNLDLIQGSGKQNLLSHTMTDYAENETFAIGLARGVSEVFHSLSDNTIKEVFSYMCEDHSFNREFGLMIGKKYHTLPKKYGAELLRNIKLDDQYVKGLGNGIGIIISELDTKRRRKIWNIAEKNRDFSFGLGAGIGESLLVSSYEIINKSLKLAERNNRFANGFGSGISHLQYIDEKIFKHVRKLLEQNENFARGYGHGLGHLLDRLDKKSEKLLWSIAKKNSVFAFGLFEGAGHLYDQFDSKIREKLWNNIHELHKSTMEGFVRGLAYKFNRYSKEIINEIIKKSQGYHDLEYFFGTYIGYDFDSLTEINRELVLSKAKNNNFSNGLGRGLGYHYTDFDSIIQEKIWTKINDERFANGVGYAFGIILDKLDVTVKNKIWALAKENDAFAFGFGEGISSLTSTKFERPFHILAKKIMKKNPYLARGLGIAESVTI